MKTDWPNPVAFVLILCGPKVGGIFDSFESAVSHAETERPGRGYTVYMWDLATGEFTGRSDDPDPLPYFFDVD
jgi:hypothetical protein